MLLESIEMGASGTAKIAAGGSSFLVRQDFLAELGFDPSLLKAGVELSGEEAELLHEAARASAAFLAATALLARAEQSSQGLRFKLLERGHSPAAINRALRPLLEAELLSDQRYAEAWLRGRLRRPGQGPATLLRGLRGRGIDEASAKTALKKVLGPEERRELLARAAAEFPDHRAAARDAARRHLRALGFGSEEIRNYFEEEEPH